MALAQQVQLQRDPGARTDLARRVVGSPALQLVGRRLLTAIPVLLGVTFLTFVVMNLIPGNPAQLILGVNASKGWTRRTSSAVSGSLRNTVP